MNEDKLSKLADMCVTGIWYRIDIIPLGKPRMTRSDRWKGRSCVNSYWAFKDELRYRLGNSNVPLPHQIKGVSWLAYFPIPKSWSKKKRAEVSGRLFPIHQVKPDRDNIDKAILDSLFGNDSGVAIGLTGKFWDDGEGPRIEIMFIT